MSLKPVLFSILTTMLLLPVVQAEESPAETAAAESPSPMEERVRAYREQFDQQVKKAELLRQEHQAEMDELRDERQAEMQETRDEHQAEMEAVREERQAEMDSMRVQRPMQRQRPVFGNQMAMQKYRDARRLEQEALAAKWREARQKQQQAQMDAFLKEREERLLSMVKRQEEMRNRAEERHNYLVENQDKIMEGLREEQVDIASRHEEQRLRAEERRRKLAVMRDTLRDMAPQERRAYMEEQREELFGEQAIPKRPARRPAPPAWTQNNMRPPFPPVAPVR